MDHRIKRNIKLDYFSIFITNLNMQGSVWVLYLAYCGLDLMQIGLLEGIYHATSMIFEVPSGAAADLLGRKKSMILSRICITVSCIIMLVSRNFWLFALSFVLQAIGGNFNSGSEEALVYDSMKFLGDEEKYIKVSGKLNMLIEVSQAIATVAGGILAEYSYSWCYITCVIISLLAFVPVLFMAEPPVTESASHRELRGLEQVVHHFKTSYGILKGDLRILKTIVYFSAIFAVHTLLFFYSQQYYSDLGYNKIQISFIFLFGGFLSCFGAILSEKLYQRLGERIAVIAGIIISMCMIAYGFEKSEVSILACIITFFFNAVLYPVESDLLNRLIPSEQRATLISVNSMFFSIIMILIFPIAGALAEIWSLPVVFMAVGILLLGFVVVWNWKRE